MAADHNDFDPKGPNAPKFTIEALAGFRCFIVVKDKTTTTATLGSPTYAHQWTPDENRALHNSYIYSFPPKAPCVGPSLDCSCGFYAFRDLDTYLAQPQGQLKVQGIINGWGKCVVGARGFRCERASIVALTLPVAPHSEWQKRVAVGIKDHWARGSSFEEVRAVVRDDLERSYPLVPIYNTVEEMLAVHKLPGIDHAALTVPLNEVF